MHHLTAAERERKHKATSWQRFIGQIRWPLLAIIIWLCRLCWYYWIIICRTTDSPFRLPAVCPTTDRKGLLIVHWSEQRSSPVRTKAGNDTNPERREEHFNDVAQMSRVTSLFRSREERIKIGINGSRTVHTQSCVTQGQTHPWAQRMKLLLPCHKTFLRTGTRGQCVCICM